MLCGSNPRKGSTLAKLGNLHVSVIFGKSDSLTSSCLFYKKLIPSSWNRDSQLKGFLWYKIPSPSWPVYQTKIEFTLKGHAHQIQSGST